MLRISINALLRVVYIYLISSLGWVHFRFMDEQSPLITFLYVLGFSLLFALVRTIIAFMLLGFRVIFIVLTVGVGLFLVSTIFSCLVLWLFSLAPWPLIALTGFWPTVGAGFLLSLVIPKINIDD